MLIQLFPNFLNFITMLISYSQTSFNFISMLVQLFPKYQNFISMLKFPFISNINKNPALNTMRRMILSFTLTALLKHLFYKQTTHFFGAPCSSPCLFGKETLQLYCWTWLMLWFKSCALFAMFMWSFPWKSGKDLKNVTRPNSS